MDDIRSIPNVDLDKMPTPTFIGVGGQKCASTWLSECLRYHPEIFMSSPKELYFFSGVRWKEKNSQWYLKHFENSEGYKAVGEFSTGYLVNPVVPERIKNVAGQVQIVAIIRNPVDRFISHYKHCIREERLSKDKFGILTTETFHEAIELIPSLLNNGNYYHGIKKYIDTFGIDNVCILVKEDIDKDAKKEVRKLYNFLKVDQNYVPQIINKKVNVGIVPRYVFLERLRLGTFKFCEKRAPWVINYVRKLRVTVAYKKLNSRKREDDFQIEDSVLQELALYYRNEIINIQNLLGRRLDAWDS